MRATDDLGLTTSSTNRGSLTINAQVPGDAPPDGRLTVTGTQTGGQSLSLNLAGTATDDKGVSAVNLTLYDNDTSKYLQPNGQLGNGLRDAFGHPRRADDDGDRCVHDVQPAGDPAAGR